MSESFGSSLRAWLLGPEVVEPDGAVWSWTPGGHRYPEAGGLWLAWVAMAAPDHPRAPAVAAWLERAVVEGTVGRDGVGYTFDLGVVLCGLLRWSQVIGQTPGDAARRGAAALVSAIVAGTAATHAVDPGRWSSRFGAHQRKLALALDRLDEADLVDTRDAREALWRATDGAALDIVATGEPVYVHAAAYALEGSWVLGAADVVARGASWLSEVQRADGGVPAWWDRRRGGHGPARADATAQAVRLWSATDRVRYAGAVDRGLRFLSALHDPRGGVRYDEHSAHRNVWCTLFTWQALRFADGDVRAGVLL